MFKFLSIIFIFCISFSFNSFYEFIYFFNYFSKLITKNKTDYFHPFNPPFYRCNSYISKENHKILET